MIHEYISMKELMGTLNISDIPHAHQINLEELKNKLNFLRESYGHPFVITSGYRTEADQKRINPKVTKSMHMIGCAADISDPTGKINAWLKTDYGKELALKLNLFFEERQGNWQHVQIRPFASWHDGGTRWFNP